MMSFCPFFLFCFFVCLFVLFFCLFVCLFFVCVHKTVEAMVLFTIFFSCVGPSIAKRTFICLFEQAASFLLKEAKDLSRMD